MQRVLMAAALIMAAPVLAQEKAAGLTMEEAAEQQVWIDEHARWNAEHMAASRLLTDIAESLRRHDTNFDTHGNAVRAHGASMTGRRRADVAQAQARLRAAHEEARSAHHHLMADVDALAAVMRERFAVTPP